MGSRTEPCGTPEETAILSDLTVPSRFFFVVPFCYLCFVSVMFRVCSLKPCGRLLGKG